MRMNINKLPEGKALPAKFKDEEPIHVAQGMVADGGKEVVYKVLCKSSKYVDIPESALVAKK